MSSARPQSLRRARPPRQGRSFCARHDAGQCHSCPHADVPLRQQVARKQERLAQVLTEDLIPSRAWLDSVASPPTRFRNKAKMVVSGSAKHPILGIVGPQGPVDLRHCPLHVEAIEESLGILAQHVRALGLRPYSVAARSGELKYILVTASPDGELMVRWVLRSHTHVPDIAASVADLHRLLPSLAVASVNIQPVHQAIIEGEEEIVLSTSSRLLMRLRLPVISDAAVSFVPDADRQRAASSAGTSLTPPSGGRGAGSVRELPLWLPTRSFFQTNTPIAESLYATAAAWCDQAGSEGRATQEIWDLFCGVGGFGLALAAPGRRIRGVEVSASAIEGARQSVSDMGLDEQMVSFEAGDARVLDPGQGLGPEVLVVNPPRRGIGAQLAQKIEAASQGRLSTLLYSSCNPVSLAQDLRHLPSFEVHRAQLFDMFPHTDHAEVLVELRRRSTRL